MLRLSVDFTSLDDDEQVVLKGSQEFENLSIDDQQVMDAIQVVVDKYEDDGLTIDQGADIENDTYELNLPDGFDADEMEAGMLKATSLLNDVEAALRSLGTGANI